jgi:predicted 3-demethylubiquinone-9 3-methyltransferase (glyoxalase superfamily)
MSKLGLCLWFDDQAEAAANFYVETFRAAGRAAEIRSVVPYGNQGLGTFGTVMTVSFSLEDRTFLALNGGPHFNHTPAMSLMVHCRDQKEIDFFWDRLIEGGSPSKCGWLVDRFGVSWQIVPDSIEGMLTNGQLEQRDRMMAAVMTMVKLDKDAIERAFQGAS